MEAASSELLFHTCKTVSPFHVDFKISFFAEEVVLLLYVLRLMHLYARKQR